MVACLDAQRFPALPAFDGEPVHAPFEGHDNTVTYGFVCREADKATAYRQTLWDAGFVKTGENRFSDATFSVFERDDLTVHTAHYPTLGVLKVNAATSDTAAAFQPVQKERFWTPSITQIGRKGALQWAPGMSYIFRNADGSYVIMDGGPYDAEDVDHLMTFLQVHQPKAGKPVISLWLFSHPHPDHMNLALAFWDKYHDNIELQAVGFNFPDMEHTELGHENPASITRYRNTVLEKMAAYFPNARRITPHAGDRYVFDGYVIDTLPTYEDMYPDTYGHINYFSLAWMVRSEHQKVLLMGDCGRRLSALIAATCREDLKCDILQVCHHGNHGATMELYQYADPDICLWPEKESMLKTEPFLLGTKEGFAFNAWLWNSRQRLHLNNSLTTTFELN